MFDGEARAPPHCQNGEAGDYIRKGQTLERERIHHARDNIAPLLARLRVNWLFIFTNSSRIVEQIARGIPWKCQSRTA